MDTQDIEDEMTFAPLSVKSGESASVHQAGQNDEKQDVDVESVVCGGKMDSGSSSIEKTSTLTEVDASSFPEGGLQAWATVLAAYVNQCSSLYKHIEYR